MWWPNLRASEWLLLGFFVYVTVLSAFLLPPALCLRALSTLGAVSVVLIAVSALSFRLKGVPEFRDFLPIALTLVAFREMELFIPARYGAHLEAALQGGDRILFSEWHFRSAIESLGRLIPGYLEFCYLLVYALPFVCVGLLYGTGRRGRVDRFYLVYLPGTLLAYALFPYFPSRPPRLAFAGEWMPTALTAFRRLNLFLLKEATIHTAVFPSAHVSSAFAAGWAFLILYWPKLRFGIALLVYAVSVSVATVYGRYHYAADVVAGFGVSLIAAAIGVWVESRRAKGDHPSYVVPHSRRITG